MKCKAITIVGGGLAGLTLGIGLREKDIPTTVIEASRYPRHRVCGEFICGRGHEALSQLGLDSLLGRIGALESQTVLFQAASVDSPIRRLPARAVSISRFVLDAALAERFRELGGELQQKCRWRSSDFEAGVVRATGRRLRPPKTGSEARWLGLKIHALNVRLAADLEIHLAPNGYVGICRLPNGEVNVCGLFRLAAESNVKASHPRSLLFGSPHSVLHQRLSHAQFDENSFCSVAGLALEPVPARPDECCVGDALTMIPPLTGNGMSIAFESARLALEPLVSYSEGSLSWAEVRAVMARQYRATFSSRLKWAKWLHWFLFSRLFAALGPPALRSELVWNTLFRHTR